MNRTAAKINTIIRHKVTAIDYKITFVGVNTITAKDINGDTIKIAYYKRNRSPLTYLFEYERVPYNAPSDFYDNVWYEKPYATDKGKLP